MFKRGRSSVWVLSALLATMAGGTVRADETESDEAPEGALVLEAVDGNAPVEILRGGNWTAAAEGATVMPGESVRTADGSARLVYNDGSAVALSTNTEVQLQTEPGRVLELERGTVWGKIEKKPVTEVVPAAGTPSVYRFTLKSRSVVMGVRGTEFVVESGANGETAVNTLEGTVDTAPDLSILRAGHGVPVHRLERIRARAGTPFGKAEAFRSEEFGARLAKEHGGLARFLKRPVRRMRAKRPGFRRGEGRREDSGARLRHRGLRADPEAAPPRPRRPRR